MYLVRGFRQQGPVDHVRKIDTVIFQPLAGVDRGENDLVSRGGLTEEGSKAALHVLRRRDGAGHCQDGLRQRHNDHSEAVRT